MATMKTQTDVSKLTTKMNLKNSVEPHIGSSSFPIKRRPIMLITTCNITMILLKTKNTGDKGHECSIITHIERAKYKENNYPVDWLFSVSSSDEIPTKRNSPRVNPNDSKLVEYFDIYAYHYNTWSYHLLHSFSSRCDIPPVYIANYAKPCISCSSFTLVNL